MAGELLIGSNWVTQDALDNESPEYSMSWEICLCDVVAMLWMPGYRVQNLTFSITGGNDGEREPAVEANQANLNILDKTLKTRLETRKLEYFLRCLDYVEIPTT